MIRKNIYNIRLTVHVCDFTEAMKTLIFSVETSGGIPPPHDMIMRLLSVTPSKEETTAFAHQIDRKCFLNTVKQTFDYLHPQEILQYHLIKKSLRLKETFLSDVLTNRK